MNKYIVVVSMMMCIVLGQYMQAGGSDYSDPAAWGGICQSGTKQSPINI